MSKILYISQIGVTVKTGSSIINQSFSANDRLAMKYIAKDAGTVSYPVATFFVKFT